MKKFAITLNRIMKRCFDIVVAFLLLIILSPLIIYFFCRIYFDGGHVIFADKRVGLNGKKFKCYKFRTMVFNSNKILNDLLIRDSDAKKEWEKYFKLKNDPRITRVGRFLRKSSFDELPQLWNVLIGDMSIIGPRPIIDNDEQINKYGIYLKYYYSVRPGMSGLWQISGRNELTFRERIKLDMKYIKSATIFTDIYILFKTIPVLIFRKGAY